MRQKIPSHPDLTMGQIFVRIYIWLGLFALFFVIGGEIIYGDPFETLQLILFVGALYMITGATLLGIAHDTPHRLPRSPITRP